MTSIFDQYNSTLKREDPMSGSTVNALTSSGYVSVRTKEETPIFSKQKMKINLPHDILFLKVCNNWLVTLMSHQVLLRLYLLQPDRQDGSFTFDIFSASISFITSFFFLLRRGILGQIFSWIEGVKLVSRSVGQPFAYFFVTKVTWIFSGIAVFAP